MYFDETRDERIAINATISGSEPKAPVMLDGVYPYTVMDFKTGNYPGSRNIPECGKITLTMTVNTPEGKARVWEDLFLCKSMTWKLSGFFQSIGLKKADNTPFQMDWSKVIGARGVANFKPKSYISKDGEQKTVNGVKNFVDYDEKYFANMESVQFIELSDETELPL